MNDAAPAHLSRRGFLALGGGSLALVGLGGIGQADPAYRTGIESSSTALTGGYPRMLAFRQSEMQVPLLSYDDWAPIFSQFNGIIGKALQEERTDAVGPQTLDYFTRYKQQFPGKLVLLHLNGRARLPRFETAGWSAGWWLYREGSVLTSAAQPGDTVLEVASTSNFRLRADKEGNIGDDLVIAPMGPGGRPDFAAAEQLRLSGIDVASKSLTVLRGRHGTAPLAFAAGAYLGRHVYAGPWSAVDERVWLYNLSTMCPPDATGRQVVDALLEQFQSWFAPDGVLAAFDGVQLDVFQLAVDDRSGVDADCNGVVDLAVQDGVDTYLEGQIQLTSGLRQILGPERYLITDGGVGQEPDRASVNGIEVEGFPSLFDYGMTRWSQALMALQLWRLGGANPRLSYPLYKFVAPNDYPVSFNRFRLTLAAALATDSVVCWFNDVGGSSGVPNPIVVWDELVAGTARQPGWLGVPRGQAIHLAERSPDLLAGTGVDWPAAFVDTFIGPDLRFTVQSTPRGPVLVASRRQASTSLTFTIPDLALDGPDVVLAVDLFAWPRVAYAATISRKCTVTVAGAGGELAQTVTVPTAFFHTVLGYRGIGPGPIEITFSIEGDPPLRLRGLRMFAGSDSIVRGYARGAVFANPSDSDVTFDVAALFPGRSFARITGSADQDPVTNDGTGLGSTLTLGPLDALVVRAV